MKYLLLLTINLFLCSQIFSNEKLDSLLVQLDNTLENRDIYLIKKQKSIMQIDDKLNKIHKNAPIARRYDLYNDLYYEYEFFIYDSAFVYAEKMRELAYRNLDFEKIVHAKVKLGNIFMTAGMFKEALDTLNSIPLETIPNGLKNEYYMAIGQTYYRLTGYNNEYFSQRYIALGNQYMDSALVYTKKHTLDYWLREGIRKMNSINPTDAIGPFQMIIKNTTQYDHKYAIAASGLGFVYSLQGDIDKNIEMLLLAAIADIKASTKETVALRNLSEQLAQQGNINASYKYIKLALEDATFFNSRQRKIEIATIMPLINDAMLNQTVKTKALVIKYAIIISFLSLIILFFIIVIFKQLRKLKNAEAVIIEANNNLQALNSKLFEANKIKEEYIGYFFSLNSENIDRVEKLRNSIKRNITLGRIDEVKNIINEIDLYKEREVFFKSFDKIFLKLFPNFVDIFNSYFKEEDRVIIKENDLLTPELRIFALIRMGITDTERIAKILEYSVRTIYAYKTKIRNKSIFPNDQFEEKVMEIRAIN